MKKKLIVVIVVSACVGMALAWLDSQAVSQVLVTAPLRIWL